MKNILNNRILKFSDKTIHETYTVIEKYYNQYLQPKGVKLPSLTKNGKYTKNALVLIYLAFNYPHTKIVTKYELTDFIRQYYPDTNDVQQARHLAAQDGWMILSGTRNDKVSTNLHAGEYQLTSLEQHYPGFIKERRQEFFEDDAWEKLKANYDYRCACCGSREGESHRYRTNTITRLQKGHMNPNKPLTLDNTIPQCEFCNRPDRNYWIYDKRGRVIGVANAKVIDTCSSQVQKEIYERIQKKS